MPQIKSLSTRKTKRALVSRRKVISALILLPIVTFLSFIFWPKVKWKLLTPRAPDPETLLHLNMISYFHTIFPCAEESDLVIIYEKLSAELRNELSIIHGALCRLGVLAEAKFYTLSARKRKKVIKKLESSSREGWILKDARKTILHKIIEATPDRRIIGYTEDMEFFAGVNWGSYDRKVN